MAFYFWKERSCFVDISFQTFSMCQSHHFFIQNFRFVAFITQLFEWIAIHANASLREISITISLAFVILYLSVFAICLLVFKDVKYALLMLMYNILMATHTFFWIQSELTQGIAFMILWFAFYRNVKSVLMKNILLVPAIVSIVFSHPLIVFPFLFTAILFILLKERSRRDWVLSILIFVIASVVKKICFSNSYDNQSIDRLIQHINGIKTIFQLHSTIDFGFWLIHDYYFLMAGFMLSVSILFVNRKWELMALLTSFSLGFLLIMLISYSDGATQFYMENQYMLLGFFVSAILIFCLMDQLKKVQFKSGVVAIVCFVGLIRIFSAHDIYSNRLSWFNAVHVAMQKTGCDKIIINPNQKLESQLVMTWGVPYEYWLYSTLMFGKSESLNLEQYPNELKVVKDNHTFISRWGNFDYKDLNEKYFSFDRTQSYRRITLTN